MQKCQSNKAFSLLEISIVILIIGILISGVSLGVDLYRDFRLASAKSLTQNSRVGRIEGLVLWLEASQKTSFEPDNIADGTAITKWKNIAPNLLPNDRSRFDAVKSGQAESGPIYRENIVNSLPALEMSSSQNRCMQVPSGFDGNGKNTTVFLVIKTAENWSSTADYRMLSRWPAGAFYEIRGTNTPFSNLDNFSFFNYYNSAKNKLYILNLIINRSENVNFYFNKTPLQSISSSWNGVYSSSDLYIGCKAGGTALFPNANYLEIIIYDRVITDKERIAIEEYLSKKWGNFN
jgi:prepilin-type N-terminal cleavage/methylation domain-containing protein